MNGCAMLLMRLFSRVQYEAWYIALLCCFSALILVYGFLFHMLVTPDCWSVHHVVNEAAVA